MNVKISVFVICVELIIYLYYTIYITVPLIAASTVVTLSQHWTTGYIDDVDLLELKASTGN